MMAIDFCLLLYLQNCIWLIYLVSGSSLGQNIE